MCNQTSQEKSHNEATEKESNPVIRLQMYNASSNPKTFTWQRLEDIRLERLGINNKYSRHFNVLRSMPDKSEAVGNSMILIPSSNIRLQAQQDLIDKCGDSSAKSRINAIAPFTTLGKPTCGFFFSRDTENRKRNFGIPPSDLVKWRSATSSS